MKLGKVRLLRSKKDKILFPSSKITKKDIVLYYESIADHMLPYLKDRPLTMQRFPNGITKEGFFQKNASDYFPSWIETVKVKKVGGWVNHVICNTKETLLYLANQYVLTFHVALSKITAIDHPDKLIFDLDPPKDNFNLAIKAARSLKLFLENELDLKTFVMTSGSSGLHVVVPLLAKEDFKEVHKFARLVSEYIANRNPDEFTTLIRKDQRKGRLYIDYLRNSYAQISVCPYSLRAKENAPVATPLNWTELNNATLTSQSYTIRNIFKRLEQTENPWANFDQDAKNILVSINKLQALIG